MEETYMFIVDTNQYSGNFERELCAHLTGVLGDCEVGKKISENTKKELPKVVCEWFQDNTEQVADDHGTLRPCSIWDTPKEIRDNLNENIGSVVIYFHKRPSKKLISIMRERATTFPSLPDTASYEDNKSIKILGFRLEKKTVETNYITLEL